MTLLKHLVAYDVRRLPVALTLWILVVAANRVVEGASAVYAANPSLREAVAVLGSVLWLAELLLGFALVSLVVHAHPTVGTDAFWLTRPIPPRLLLASKLMILGTVLVVLPALADAVLLGAHQMPAAIAAGVLLQTASTDTLWFTLLIIAAALTRGLTTFALLIGAALLSAALAIGITIAILMGRFSEGVSDTVQVNNSGLAGVVIFNVGFLIAALAMLSVQYVTRRRSRSITVGLIGVALALFVSWVWPLPFLSPIPLLPEWARDERLSVSVDARTISTNTEHMIFPGEQRQSSVVNGDLRVSGLQPGWTAAVIPYDASIKLANGETLASAGSRYAPVVSSEGEELQPYATLRNVLNVTTIASAAAPPEKLRPELYPTLFLIRQDDLARYAPATGRYRARVLIKLTHHVIDGIVPLRAGARHHRGGYRLVIDSISHSNAETVIIAREAQAASIWEAQPPAIYSFYLRNAARREAVEVSHYPLRGSFTFMQFLPFAAVGVGQDYGNGFFTRALALRFPPRPDASAEPIAADTRWLQNAELVVVRRTEEGAVERELDISEFPLGHTRQMSTSR